MSTSVNDRDRLPRLEEALSVVRRRIAVAAQRSGREARDVRLVAVTKRVEASLVRLAVGAGLTEFGENYVQELETKRPAAPDATWHFLGRVQRNKAKRVVETADLIQTLEPGRGAQKMVGLASSRRPSPGFLIEVDFSGERIGAGPDELDAFADRMVESGADLRGLMTVAPLGQDPRHSFARLRELGDSVRRRHPAATELSMGMSTDLEVAVEEGATMVRVGTAIFGPRR